MHLMLLLYKINLGLHSSQAEIIYIITRVEETVRGRANLVLPVL